MIRLRELLLEHPDTTYFRNEEYYYMSPFVVGIFSILKNQKNNQWISVSAFGDGGDVITSSPQLNDWLQEQGIDWDYQTVHPDLLAPFVQLGMVPPIESAFAYRNARPDIPVNGRVWEIKDKLGDGITHLVSFWNRHHAYLQHISHVDKALKLLNVNPEHCMYEFIESPNQWLTYKQVQSIEKKAADDLDSEQIKRLMKIQHTNPEAKKILKQLIPTSPDKLQVQADELGTTVAALKHAMGLDEQQSLTEDPDGIDLGHTYISYDDDYTVAVVCFGTWTSQKLKFRDKRGWLAYHLGKKVVVFNGKEIFRPKGFLETHGDLIRQFQLFDGVSRFDASDELHSDRFHRMANMRLYEYEGVYYAPFWEPKFACKKVLPEIHSCLNYFTGGNAKKVNLQFEGQGDNKFVSFEKAFSSRIKRTKSKAQSELRRQLHLMDPNQKAEFLKKLGAMQPDRLEQAADKLGITTIELRQALGLDIAENSLGNLSFSDHDDPDIPYEAKPRTALAFNYGTNFG